MIRRILNRLAYPVFDCEGCIGMAQHGCYCSSNDASAPCMPATRLQRIALWFVRRL
jgi:hypothetical protein